MILRLVLSALTVAVVLWVLYILTMIIKKKLNKGDSMKNGTKLMLVLISTLVLSGCGFEVVDTGYRGIKTNFGKVVGEALEVGLCPGKNGEALY